MAQLNLLERATEAAVILNSKKRNVMDMWLNGIKVWPLDRVIEFYVDKNLVILGPHNSYHEVLRVFASKGATWSFEV